MENKPDIEPPNDGRSPFAVGYAWAVRISNLGIEMALPILLGVWLDHLLGTVVVFLLLGIFLGMAIAVLQLIKIVREGRVR